MRFISLMSVGSLGPELLQPLAERLTQRLGAACSIQPGGFSAEFAFNRRRRQYHSAEILKKLLRRPGSSGSTLLAVTDVDLYVHGLAFVFGDSQRPRGAVVSTYRLRQEFYGLPADPGLLQERLLKAALHEFGHTYGLRHCPHHSCAMSAASSVEQVDLKRPAFCVACAASMAD